MTESTLLPELISMASLRTPAAPALSFAAEKLSYCELDNAVRAFASGLMGLGLPRAARVGIYLEKRFETVIASFGAPAAGGVFVPMNPLLKPEQVAFIARDCDVCMLVTSPERLALLAPVLAECTALRYVAVTAMPAEPVPLPSGVLLFPWHELLSGPSRAGHRVIDTDMAAILYTSGSTGRPKGVVLSHRNMVAGGKSVASYLGNGQGDTLLAALPLSFDAGFSQLTTAFHAGASSTLPPRHRARQASPVAHWRARAIPIVKSTARAAQTTPATASASSTRFAMSDPARPSSPPRWAPPCRRRGKSRCVRRTPSGPRTSIISLAYARVASGAE